MFARYLLTTISQASTNQTSTNTNSLNPEESTTIAPTVTPEQVPTVTPNTMTELSSVTGPQHLPLILDDKEKKTQRGKLHGSALKHLDNFSAITGVPLIYLLPVILRISSRSKILSTRI